MNPLVGSDGTALGKGAPYDNEMSADEALDQYDPPPPDDVPTCDTGPLGATVPNWSPATSFVVSGPLGQVARFPGHRFDSPDDARRWALAKYGSVITFHTLPGRWFARVPRPERSP